MLLTGLTGCRQVSPLINIERAITVRHFIILHIGNPI